jgi:hypothetical protein
MSAEIELAFARSRRRAAARRRLPRRRAPLAWRSVRAGMLAIVLLALLAESTRLEGLEREARSAGHSRYR